MATTLDNINLPSNPDLGAAEVGKDFLLFVNTGTVSTPEWQMIVAEDIRRMVCNKGRT